MRNFVKRDAVNMPPREKQSGVASIEFALGFLMFWLMCMVWVEMSYMSFVSAINDVAIAEASRSAKVSSQGNYEQIFEQVLKNKHSIWQHIANSESFRISVQYVTDMDQLVSLEDKCVVPEGQSSIECGEASKSAIAIYRTDYDYQPIFAYLLSGESVFSREVIMIQEYERSEFGI